MHVEQLDEYFDLYKFSLGSIAYCISRIRESFSERGNSGGVELADAAARLNEKARTARYKWNQQKKEKPLERKGTKQLDNRIDQTLSAILQVVEAYADHGPQNEKREAAEELVEAFFPNGVFPITSQAFADQHFDVDDLVGKLRNDYASHVQTLGIGSMIDKLDGMNTEFGQRLEPDDDGVTYDEVEAAYVEAEGAFHRLIAKAIADYGGEMEDINEVLRPLNEQTLRTRRFVQRRGEVPEVDPETGEPIDPVPTDETDPTDTTSGGGGSDTSGGGSDTSGGGSDTSGGDGTSTEETTTPETV